MSLVYNLLNLTFKVLIEYLAYIRRLPSNIYLFEGTFFVCGLVCLFSSPPPSPPNPASSQENYICPFGPLSGRVGILINQGGGVSNEDMVFVRGGGSVSGGRGHRCLLTDDHP